MAQRAMFSRCDDRLANDVRQVRSNRVVPIDSHQAQRRPCNETSAYAKKAAQNSNHKADNGQVQRIDVRIGDWKKHDLPPTARQEPEQNRGYRIENNGLTSDKQDGHERINDAMLGFELIQPVAQKMQDQEEITCDKDGINRQLGCECAQALGSILFHEQRLRGGPLLRQPVYV